MASKSAIRIKESDLNKVKARFGSKFIENVFLDENIEILPKHFKNKKKILNAKNLIEQISLMIELGIVDSEGHVNPRYSNGSEKSI